MPAAAVEQYLPRLVREWDDAHPNEPHRQIDGSMVFVDVSGFTKMSERLARHGKVGAEEVTEVIGATFDRLLAEAYAYGASLLKFGGDALLLFLSGERHALRAAAAAAEMRRALRETGSFTTTAGLVTLRMSVGIHSGAFDFFLVGDSHRELLVAGPAATTTTAMESAAAAGQVMVSQATAGLLPKANVGRQLGPGFLLVGRIGQVPWSDIEPENPEADFLRFIPVALREALTAGAAEPEHRPAAVGFIHFTEFDHLIDHEGPEAAARALDNLVGVVQRAIDGRGVAFLASDISEDGGKIILTAGVPTSAGNDEEQMLLALRRILASSPLPLQVGVNWGPVFAGEIGPHYRRTYTIMGDTVNLAARLMAKAPVGQMLTTQEVLDGSRTTFAVEALDPFSVKGKKFPIQAFSVGEPVGSRAETMGSALPLIGRDSELADLLGAWERARAGASLVAELTAEAGLGKSRLLEEFLARSDAPRVLRAECRLYQAATPYFPFGALLRQAWEMEGMEADEAEKALGALVSVHAPDLMPWLALIATTLGLEVAESREVAQLEDRFRPTRTAAVIGALLEATVTEPTIYAIEDAHWMDDASKELLGSLLAGLERQPWMVISTRRPGEGGFLAPAVDGTLRLWVVPLGDRDAEALIDSATGDRPLLPAQRRMLAERAQGHPLFLIELVHALRQGGDVEGLPHSVEGLIGSRIDRLPSHERNVLRRLAVLGTGFLAEHAASVMPESETKNPTRVLRHLGTFIDLDQKGRARFRHALIRDVAYQGLPYKTRRDLHQRVADSIRQSAGDNPVAQAELLSLHYFQAGGWSDAWQFSRVAGERAKEKFANTDAAQFFERAIAAARHVEVADERQRAQVLRDLGDVREAAGLFDDALDAYRRAARLTSEDNFKVALLIVQARVLERQGAYSRALRVLTEGCRLLEASTSQEAAGARARLSARRAIVRMAQQRDREAISVALQAAAEARSTGEKEALAEAFQVLDISSTYLGLSQDLNYGELALGLYEELGDLRGQAVINGNLGIAAYFAGRWDEALSRYEKARQASLRTGNEVQAALWGANIAEILLNQGITEKAEEILREALAVMRAAGLADSAAFAEAQLGRAINVRGKVKEGEALLRSALGQFEELGEVQSLQEASVHLAACLNLAGRPEEAIAVIGEARSAGEVTVSDAPLLRVEAEALQSLRRFPDALSAAEGAVDAANQHESPYELALALLTKAGILKDLEWKGEASEVTVAHEILRGLGVVQYPAGAAELDDL